MQTLWSKNNLQESGAKLPGRHLWDYLQTEGSKIKVEGMQHMRLKPTHGCFGQRNSPLNVATQRKLHPFDPTDSRFATEKTLHRYIYIMCINTMIYHLGKLYEDVSIWYTFDYICTCFLEQTYPKWCKLRLCWHSLALWKILGPTGTFWSKMGV